MPCLASLAGLCSRCPATAGMFNPAWSRWACGSGSISQYPGTRGPGLVSHRGPWNGQGFYPRLQRGGGWVPLCCCPGYGLDPSVAHPSSSTLTLLLACPPAIASAARQLGRFRAHRSACVCLCGRRLLWWGAGSALVCAPLSPLDIRQSWFFFQPAALEGALIPSPLA